MGVVVSHAQHGDADEHDDGPVEVLQVDGGDVGPKGPEEGKGDVGEADDVDGDAKAAEAPAGGREQVRVVEAAVEHARDGDGVGEHEGDNLQADDGVEGHVGADVDAGQQGADEAREQHGVGGDLTGGVHGGDPGGEGQAVVAREGEGLARGRRVEGHVAGHDEDQHHDRKRVDAARRDGLLEHVDEREAARVVDGVVHRRDREEVGHQEDEGEEAVADVRPDDGVGHVATGVFDFFRHVRGGVRA